MLLDRFVDLGLYRRQVERRRCLHRRILDRRHREFPDVLLHHYKPPELARIEIVHIASTEIVQGFTPNSRCPLEWILPQVHDSRHIGRDLLSRPAVGLLIELVLEVIDTYSAEQRAAEVEN